MDPLSITAAVVGTVAGVTQVFKISHKLYQKWRTKKKGKKPAEEELDNSLAAAPTEVQSKSEALAKRHGPAFREGDGTHAETRTSMRKANPRNRYFSRFSDEDFT